MVALKLVGILCLMFGFLFLMVDAVTASWDKNGRKAQSSETSKSNKVKDWLCSSIIPKWCVIACLIVGTGCFAVWYRSVPVTTVKTNEYAAAEQEEKAREVMNKLAMGGELTPDDMSLLLSTGQAELRPSSFQTDGAGNYYLPMDDGSKVSVKSPDGFTLNTEQGDMGRLVYNDTAGNAKIYYEDSRIATGDAPSFAYYDDDESYDPYPEADSEDEEDVEPSYEESEFDYEIKEGDISGRHCRYSVYQSYEDQIFEVLGYVDVGLSNYLCVDVLINDLENPDVEGVFKDAVESIVEVTEAEDTETASDVQSETVDE